jgi:hypothetical protein
MKRFFSVCVLAATFSLVSGLSACGGSKPTVTPTAPVSTLAAAGNASVNQNVEDVVPGLYPNSISNTATSQGFKVSSILVENNKDAAGNDVADHLQFTLQNLTGQAISGFEAYYTIVDTATGKTEGYYKQLAGFSLPPHGSGTVNFDGKSGIGHYGVNMHGIYGTTADQLEFKVEVSAPGFAPVYATATKAPGGAEVPGQ